MKCRSLRKHLINYAKTKDVFSRIKYPVTIGSSMKPIRIRWPYVALKKAFDAYKKENGSDKSSHASAELNEEYAMSERKKSSYAEYRKTKSEMQDWLVAQKIVQEILKEDEQKIEQF